MTDTGVFARLLEKWLKNLFGCTMKSMPVSSYFRSYRKSNGLLIKGTLLLLYMGECIQ